MKIIVDESIMDQRLDRYLRKRLKESSLSEIYKMIRSGQVKVNGRKQKESYRLLKDDILLLPVQPEIRKIATFHGQLTIVFEDDDYLVCYKPDGLKSIPDKKGEISLTGLVQTYLKHLMTDTFSVSPVSRLDRNTSGLVLFGKNYQSLKNLNDLMREQKIKKYYLALLFGTMKETKLLKLKLLKDHDKNQSFIDDLGVETQTEFHPICWDNKNSLVEVNLITGKSHQIRAVASHIGHPILGDPKYGKGGNKQLLSAYRLQFVGNDIIYINDSFRKEVSKEFTNDRLPRNTNIAKVISV